MSLFVIDCHTDEKGVKMNVHNHPIGTFADLLALIEAKDPQATALRDIASSVRRICEMVGSSPAALPMEIPELRARISAKPSRPRHLAQDI
jgi:hypothetical protein